MIEIYLDSADVAAIGELARCLPLAGVTTNPSILAKSATGLNALLGELQPVLGQQARFFAQVVSETSEAMLAEAKQLQQLPYHMVVKIPATTEGLIAIRAAKAEGIEVLATAIYSAQQGFMAALCGADYLAPYVNRIDGLGVDAVAEVATLQRLLEVNQLPTKILAASFKNTRQALSVMTLGIGAITLPIDVARQLLAHPAVMPAVAQFSQDWQGAFGDKLSFES